MSKLSEATAAHADALKNGTPEEAAAARETALKAYDEATEAEKKAVFPHRP